MQEHNAEIGNNEFIRDSILGGLVLFCAASAGTTASTSLTQAITESSSVFLGSMTISFAAHYLRNQNLQDGNDVNPLEIIRNAHPGTLAVAASFLFTAAVNHTELGNSPSMHDLSSSFFTAACFVASANLFYIAHQQYQEGAARQQNIAELRQQAEQRLNTPPANLNERRQPEQLEEANVESAMRERSRSSSSIS